MSEITTVQVKRVAHFLKASCAKIPQSSDSPKLGQWLDIISRASGFRDWNAMSAKIDDAPTLSKEESQALGGRRTFFGIARILIAGEEPKHYVTSANLDHAIGTREQIATELAKRIRLHLTSQIEDQAFRYGQPDTVLPDGRIAASWVNADQSCPIVISSKSQKVLILLWWLNERYQLPENRSAWMQDSPSHYICFENRGDSSFLQHEEDKSDDSLTHVFLQQLTGKKQQRRTCLYLPRWTSPSDVTTPMLVEEGNPDAKPADVQLAGQLPEMRVAIDAHNAKLGLSTIDCAAISARYEYAEKIRNEDDYIEGHISED